MIISVDFDGTVVEHDYPDIGEPLEGIQTLRDLIVAGHTIVLNTCREDTRKRQYLTEAVRFLKKHGVEVHSVNENRREDDFRDDGGRKVYAHCYIDDRNLGGFPGWNYVRQAFGLTANVPTEQT
jgi:trehalose-6-phosphatase